MLSTIWDRWRDARRRVEEGGERAVVLDRFRDLCASLERKRDAAATRGEHREKVSAFLARIDDAFERLGDQLFQPSYLLNVIGDAVVRSALISQEAVETLRVGLYFHGLRVIERRFAPRSATYFAVHADLLETFLGRDALKQMVADGREKIEAGKVFCLTYHYLNALKKAYWALQRKAADALDHVSVEAEAVEPSSEAAEPALDATDRVGLMMEIFRRKLSATQQLVYLAKNRSGESACAAAEAAAGGDDALVKLLRELDAELEGHGNLGWSEIAARLSINEKTAKREYLRALHTLLQESARAVFGMDIESGYVRRVLAQLREIVYEKDLRIRTNAGEGLSRLVEKWEVALRFVLNHGRVSA
ncbi:MAG TPA: hypothetical protein VEI02_04960 [Planctomycetota bacterium]|nr:hypothetical protein [Planctomycetota bacterium]